MGNVEMIIPSVDTENLSYINYNMINTVYLKVSYLHVLQVEKQTLNISPVNY